MLYRPISNHSSPWNPWTTPLNSEAFQAKLNWDHVEFRPVSGGVQVFTTARPAEELPPTLSGLKMQHQTRQYKKAGKRKAVLRLYRPHQQETMWYAQPLHTAISGAKHTNSSKNPQWRWPHLYKKTSSIHATAFLLKCHMVFPKITRLPIKKKKILLPCHCNAQITHKPAESSSNQHKN